MAYSTEMRKAIRDNANGTCQISGEHIGNLGEAHSSTRLHLIYLGSRLLKKALNVSKAKQKEIINQHGEPYDGVYLSNETHNKLHHVGNIDQRKKDGRYIASPEIMHKLTYDALNLTNYSFVQQELNFINSLTSPNIEKLKQRKNELKEALYHLVDKMYTIPGVVGQEIKHCASQNGKLKSGLDAYQELK